VLLPCPPDLTKTLRPLCARGGEPASVGGCGVCRVYSPCPPDLTKTLRARGGELASVSARPGRSYVPLGLRDLSKILYIILRPGDATRCKILYNIITKCYTLLYKILYIIIQTLHPLRARGGELASVSARPARSCTPLWLRISGVRDSVDDPGSGIRDPGLGSGVQGCHTSPPRRT